MEGGKIRCTQDDLDHVIFLFRRAIEAELKEAPGTPLDLDRMSSSFTELITENMEIIPSFEEDQKAQKLRNEIETMQRKAVRMKSSLQSKRTNFIEAVQDQTERSLEEKRPIVADSVYIEDLELPNELELHLKSLDDAIATLTHQLQQTQENMERQLPKCDEFGSTVQKIIDDF